MRGGQVDSGTRAELSLRRKRGLLQHVLLALVVALGPVALSGCAGLVSGNTTSSPPPPSTLVITNVQAPSDTTSTSQIVWTTNVAANSAVDYGTTTSYGSSTPVDSTMVTNHQVTVSGLAAGTTYYYQVSSTDSKGNHGQSGGHTFKTVGFSLSGTISPAAGGSGATLTLSGAASATTTADSLGNYIFSGLPNGTYTVAPSHAGFTFIPSSQSMVVSGTNVTGVNFTDSAAAVAPTITTQPGNQIATAGQTATFTVVATGTAPLSYQWRKSGVNIAGATAASYTTPATTTADSGANFDVVVSNTAGTVTSVAATLTVNPAAVAPTIITQPGNQTVTAGQTAAFTVVAAGAAPLSYQWQKNGVNIAGATSTSYTTPVTTTADSGASFDVVVSNTAGTVTSSAATLTVNAAAVAPTITAQPGNQTVTAGQTAAFTVVAAGTAPLSYQWQKNGANIAGATSTSYTTPVTTTADSGTSFAVVVSNTAGTVTSAAATLTVNPAPVAPTITTQPGNQTVTAGQTATFTVVAAGTAPLSYQWQKNGVNIAGATSTSYTTPVTTTADSGSTFDVVVSNTAGTVTSAAATLTVNPAPVAPTITTPPANQTVTAGQTATFTVVAAGTAPLNYQWQKSGANIAGATSASYTTPATVAADSGSTFDVVVSNTAGTVTSAAATLTVNPALTVPSITSLNPASGLVGASVTIAGANFGATQGTSAVKFNGTTATATSWSAASITAAVPSGATTGNVVVTVGGVASNGVNFTVASGPAISGISVGSITTTGAIVSWTTDVVATSQVEYGTTTAYGSLTTLGSTLVTSHSVALTGLSTSTLYHYRVRSKNSSGVESISGDFAFQTSSVVDTTPPTIAITAPANGVTVSGSVTVSANASDNVGVASVQFFLDGSNLGSLLIVAPYSVAWNTATASNGAHTLTAQAKDAAGNVGNAVAVSVTVANSTSTATQDFQNRCAATGVIVCQGFNTAAIFSTGFTPSTSNGTVMTQDTTTARSGTSSAHCVVPAQTGPDAW